MESVWVTERRGRIPSSELSRVLHLRERVGRWAESAHRPIPDGVGFSKSVWRRSTFDSIGPYPVVIRLDFPRGYWDGWGNQKFQERLPRRLLRHSRDVRTPTRLARHPLGRCPLPQRLHAYSGTERRCCHKARPRSAQV